MTSFLLEKKLSLRSDFFITGLNGIANVFGIFWVSAYLARSLGLDALGEYLFLKRTVTASLGVLLLGLNVALPTLIAKNGGRGYGDAAAGILLLVTIPLIFLLSNLNFISQIFSTPHILFILGFCLLTLAYALYRGHLNMIGANLLQLMAGTVVSIGAAYLAYSIEEFLFIVGSGMIVISIFAFLQRNKGLNFARIGEGQTKILIRFGLVRIPGFAFQFFLLAGSPLLLFPYLTMSDQAFFNAGISLVRLFLMIVGPLSIILLPRVSTAMADGISQELTENLSLMVKAILFYGAITGLTLSQLSGEIMIFWLGEATNSAIKSAQILLWSTPFFVLCVILRSPIDAGSYRGYNSIIYGVGVAGMVATLLLVLANKEPIIAGSWGFLIGHILAASISYFIGAKMFKLEVFSLGYVLSVATSILFVITLLIIIPLVGHMKLFVSIGFLIGFFLAHFFLSKELWIVELRKSLLK